MNLTFSDNDNEALSALRKANGMMKKERLMWGDFLPASSSAPPRPGKTTYSWDSRKEEAQSDEGGRTEPKSKEEVDQTIEALKVMASRLQGAKKEFVEGCLDFFKTRGYLTGKQAKVLQGIARGMTL